MAKKKVPLERPKGTNGDGNIQVPGGPVVLDLGDFDDIFGPMESDSPKDGPLGEFWTGLKQSLSDRVRTKDVVRNFLRSAAPDGISNLMGFADEAMSATRDIKDSLERTNAADLQYIAKRAQALLPQIKDYAPDTLYDGISQGLENKIEEYDYTIQSSRDQTPIRRAAQEQRTENEIKAAMDNIALTERLNHNRSEQAANIRHNQNRAEASIRDVLQTKRFDFISRAMGVATDGIQRIAGYNEQVNYGFQRKGLELQFRSYMGIKELVKLTEANLELQARAYSAMIRNTGMTDFQKNGAKGLDQMPGAGAQRSPGLMGKAMQSVANRTLSGYLGNYGGEVQNRVTSDISRKLSMAVMAMKMGEGGPSLWDQKYKMAGSLAGDFGSDFLLNELIPMLGREARPGLTSMSNKHFGGKHNQIGYYLDNMPAFLQEFVNNGQNQYGLRGKVRDILAPFVPQFGLNDRTTSSNFQTIDQPAQFNQATQRTIVDAIPGYLARLLQEMRMIRTGRDDVAREVWDITTGTFKAESSAHDAIQNKIVPKSAIRSASATINDALNTMDEDGKLSPQARKALSERMLRDASTNRRFDPEAYIKSRGYAADMPPEVAQELESFFKGKFDFDDKGEMKDTADNHKLRQEFSQAFLDIRSISRDPIKEIQRMINTGHTEPLRAIGIIITEDGHDKINYPRIWEILRSGVTGHNPWANGGDGFDPNKDDKSGDVTHRDFVGPAFPGHEAAWAKNKMIRFRSRYAPEEQMARDKMAKHLKTMRARFGTAAQSVKEGYDQASDVTGEHIDMFRADPRAYANMAKSHWAQEFNHLKDKTVDHFTNADIDELKGKAQGYGVKGMEKITDLYSQFDPTKPLLKGIDFSNGNLIDVNTKKIVMSPKDITGEVINKLGQTVVTATEAAAGLMSPAGDVVVKAVENSAQKISDAIQRHTPKLGGSAGASTEDQDPNSEESLSSQDWTLDPGEEEVVITARGMQNGEYFNTDGKVLKSIKDITGDVLDKTGNIVLTGKEFANGLWSKRKGTRYRPTKGFARLLKLGKAAGKFSGQTAGSLALGALKFTAKAAVGIASRAFNFFVDNQNAYLPGERIPVLTRRAVQNGEYYDDKGNVIEDFVDVYSLIYDSRGELVIQPDQYKQLKNYDGTKHILAKNQRIWSKFVMRPMRAIRNAYINQTKKYYKWLGRKTVSVGGWLGKKTLGGFAKAGGMIFDRMFEKIPDEDQGTAQAVGAGVAMGTQGQTQILGEILQELRDQKPKEDRKGSWQDQAKRKAANAQAWKKEAGDDEEESKDGFLKRGLKGLAGMLGFGKDKDDEEDDDGFGLSDLADIADIGDAVGDSRERGRRRKGRTGKGGRLAKWGKKAASSKIGQKLMQGAVGRAGSSILARGAIMAGSALAGLLSAPVLIGGTAAAATVGATYFGVKRYSAIHGDFRELRFAQYGVDEPTKKGLLDDIMDMSLVSFGGDKVKILKLEALIEKYTAKDTPNPSFSISAAGGTDILNVMGIDIDEEADVMVFARWMEKRFKPVYLAWQAGLFKMGKPEIKIDEVDEKLPDELKADFLEAIRFPSAGDTPYAVRENPFSSKYELQDNTKTIEKMFEELAEKYGEKRKKKDEGKEGDKAGAIKSESEKGTGDAAKKAAAAGAAGGAYQAAVDQGSKNIAKNIAGMYNEGDPKKKGVYTGPSGIAGAAMAVGTLSGNVTLINQRIGNTLTALQAIRMRAYGMQTMNLSDVKAVLALEAEYAKNLTATPYSVDYNGDEFEFLQTAGKILGKDTSTGSADRPKLFNWLTDRFGPAFRSYYGAAKNAQPAANLANIESKLTGSDRVTVAQAVLGSIAGYGSTIWELPSIFEVKGPLEDLKKMADLDLEHLKKQAEKEVASSPTQKASDQVAGKNSAASGGSFAEKAMATIKDTWANAKETVSTAWNNAKDAVGEGVASAKIAVGMGPDYGAGGATGGVIQSAGNGGTVLQGNGGKWESIPMPAMSGSAKAAQPTLKAVADMTGVPVDWLMAIAGIESGFRYDVKASTSSATGWFQFINSTWDTMYAKYGPKYGCPPDSGKTRAARNDPRINALMGAEYIRTNYEGLKKGLGRSNLTDVDVYMAHFLGLGGALKFFRADPNAMAYKVFQKEYSANMPLFFVNSKASQPRTIAEIYKLFQAKIEKFWATTGKGLRSGESPTVGQPEAQQPGKTEPEKSPEDQAREKLAADAKSKEGVAAQADPNAPAGPGSENAATEKAAQPSVSSIVSSTAPMPGAPGAGGGSTAPTANSSTNATGTSSGGSAVDEQRNAILAQSQSQNVRRESEVRRDQQVTADVSEHNTRMYGVTVEIRDLMKVLVEKLDIQKAEQGQKQSSESGGSNSMTTQQKIQGRAASQRPSAVTLR